MLNYAHKIQVSSIEIFSGTKSHQSFKVILFWTRYFGSTDFDFGLGWEPFIKANCPSNGQFACMTTSDRSFFNHSDAIVFHGRDIKINDLPPPSWRLPHQHYIFVLYESPVNTNMGMLRDQFKNFFNRTMTYRRDSDILLLHPYGCIKCNNTSPSSTCRGFPRTNNSTQNALSYSSGNKFQIDLSQKNRTIAWFVSNCRTSSQRELLVRNLSLHIPVDIYGPCYNLSCPRGQDCNQMLGRHYRFYLSFENSLCPDYVTEKLYRPMSYDTVPVVFGGSDYSYYLPVGSYVDARNFTTPLDLANFLKRLMSDDELYLSYFQWRRQYFVDPNPPEGWCQLCKFISSDAEMRENKIYVDIEAWWAGRLTNQSCFSAPASLVSFTEPTTPKPAG